MWRTARPPWHCSARSARVWPSSPGSAASTSAPRSPGPARAIRPWRPASPSRSGARRPFRCTRPACSWPARRSSRSEIAAKLGKAVAHDSACAEHPSVILLPLITAIVATAFALVVLRQYAGHRRTYQLMWATGFAMFAVAAFAGYLARSGGTTDSEYRLFYLFGAILNVACLALGTMYLLAPPRWANVSLAVVAVPSLLAAYAVFSAPVGLP